MYDDKPWLEASVAWHNLTSDLAAGRDLSAESDRFVAELVAASSSNRKTVWPSRYAIFRARFMPVAREFDTEPLPLSEMGAPPAADAKHNRLSPEDTPLFYGALEPETALAEIRPWLKARVSIAQCHSMRDLILADLTWTAFYADYDPAVALGWLMSRPTHPDDKDRYLGTQLLATRFKAAGFDGVLYRSRLRDRGTNVAIFDDTLVNRVGASLLEVTGVEYSMRELVPFPPQPPQPEVT